MKTLLLALFLASSATLLAAESAKPEIVKTDKNIRIEIFYFHKGTRSEGIHGALFIKNEEVFGQSIGAKIDTPFGHYVWHGLLKDRKQLWGESGWLPEDLSSVYPSWSTAKAEQGAAANP